MSQSLLIVLLGLMLFVSNLFGVGPGVVSDPKQPPGQEQRHADTVQGKIRNSPATLHARPDSSSETITTVRPKTPISVIAQADGWYKIQLPDGTTGWVLKMLVEANGSVTTAVQEVFGYYVQSNQIPSQPSLQQHSDQMTGLIPWAFSLDATGNIVEQMDAAHLGYILNYAGEQKLKTLALISNYDQSVHKFSGKLAHSVLAEPKNRRRAVDNIYRLVTAWGLTGVNIDFEYVYPSDRPYYSQFLRELAARLQPAGYLVTVSIPAKTWDNSTSAWSGAYDYAAIGRVADLVMLMTYDQNYASGPPGPIASISWVDKVLAYAVTQIPRQKLIMGIAGYGYSWRAPGDAYPVTYKRAIDLAQQGSGVRWDSVSKTPYAYYGDREMWFENAASISYKLNLVSRYNIRGIALWRLGQEDPQMWQLIASKAGE